MINIFLNEHSLKIEHNYSLADLLKKQGYTNSDFAIAINRCFVPKIYYSTTLLKEGDKIETISPMQGG